MRSNNFRMRSNLLMYIRGRATGRSGRRVNPCVLISFDVRDGRVAGRAAAVEGMRSSLRSCGHVLAIPAINAK